MRYLLWVLLIFSVAVALVMAAQNPGYVLLVYPPYRVELSLSLFAVLLLAGFVSAYLLVRVLAAVVRLPGTVRAFRSDRILARQRKARDESLEAYFAGSFAQAEKLAVQAIRDGDEGGLLPVLAARSAHEQHAYDRRDTYLESMRDKPGETQVLRLLTEGKFLLDGKQADKLLTRVPGLYAKAGKNHAGALALELKGRQMYGDWARVLTLLTQMEKRELLAADAATRLREQAWLAHLREQTSVDSVHACLNGMSPSIRQDEKIVQAAAITLVRLGACGVAGRLLAETLERAWSSDLAGLYGECVADGEQDLARIAQAEKWLVQHPADDRLLLALGKLCLHHQLWGKAQNYLEASLSVKASREAYNTLAQLFQATQKPDLAAQNYRRAADFK